MNDREFYRDAYERAKREMQCAVRSHPSLLRPFLDLCDAAETLAEFERRASNSERSELSRSELSRSDGERARSEGT